MRIISINESAGETMVWKGNPVLTGIFKKPVVGRVKISELNVAGDRQCDLKVHGGYDRAVYSYDLQDYAWWRKELNRELSPGDFGENLTTEGLLDRDVCAGDIIRAGDAILQATLPRLPCYKLAMKFQDDLMPRRFVHAGRWGIYFRVLEEGTVEAGDAIEFVSREPQHVSIADLARFATGNTIDIGWVRRALAISSLVQSWRNKLSEIAKDHEIQNENSA
jgi:MOSC domain-containing protein YiiM